MNKNNFRSVYGLANTLYGTTLSVDDFEDIMKKNIDMLKILIMVRLSYLVM